MSSSTTNCVTADAGHAETHDPPGRPRRCGQRPSISAPTKPHQAFIMVQLIFAIIAPGVKNEAFAKRMKRTTSIACPLLQTLSVCDPVAHWGQAEGDWRRAADDCDVERRAGLRLLSERDVALTAMILCGQVTRTMSSASESALPFPAPAG